MDGQDLAQRVHAGLNTCLKGSGYACSHQPPLQQFTGLRWFKVYSRLECDSVLNLKVFERHAPALLVQG